MFSPRATLLLLAATAAQATLQIIPGATWTATNTGTHVQAHGAGIIQESSTYYLIGEDKTDGSAFQNINCYSSTNLVEWTYVGALLSQTASVGDLGPDRVVERPKLIYNDDTGLYVMYMHIDDISYGEAKVGVATSSEVCGTYTYRGSFQPLGFQSRDLGLFRDEDGSGYLLTEDRENGLRIDALSADYLNVTEPVYLWSDSIEAPALFKRDGTYYMFGSHLTGWDPNDNVYSTATSLAGPWSAWATFADVGSDTYDSQTNYILPLGDGAVYLGDRWVSTNLMRSTYVWLPLTIDGTSVSMANHVNWTPDVAAGTWAVGPSETSPEAESATPGGEAVEVACSGCSGGEAVGYIGGDEASPGTLTFSGVSSGVATRSTIRIKYENGNTAQRFANVSVNGVSKVVAFLPTEDGNTPGSSSLHVDLKAGASNTVVFSTSGGAYGPDVDRIMVPVS
ncbi:Uu.00g099230.m01.CDS01 [Anthostomella pinea]|uniref:Uu.00g099230.m01.CDS01 n=1 Tax=Anthostomella pinea TaxID=933095 RepID=A0AAI8YCT4_9PEZI|nr:Uu.00g099230.m01.CDS01 [Anthostomella pinea]